ncbi:expressed unknown protein [Seminavis robusta]|uniref:Uncharacterized protein n=1 Tax=Seminavis robusta TaxID=568900 RepID=A0A9N8DKC6_9STRA|nr:expressed unknown protein [Seminavis robusta]|eukprot:Sro105_g053360.1 n/a (217) ;mRNA; f:96428-97078
MTSSPQQLLFTATVWLHLLLLVNGLCVQYQYRDVNCAHVGHFQDWCTSFDGCHRANLQCVGQRPPCSAYNTSTACQLESGCSWDLDLDAEEEGIDASTRAHYKADQSMVGIMVGATLILIVVACGLYSLHSCNNEAKTRECETISNWSVSSLQGTIIRTRLVEEIEAHGRGKLDNVKKNKQHPPNQQRRDSPGTATTLTPECTEASAGSQGSADMV